MTVIYLLTIFLFLFIAGLLCFVILIQESKSGGLGQAFGAGGDAGDSLFGTSTADVVKKFTGWLSAAFLILCVLLSFWTQSLGRGNQTTQSEIPVMEEEA